MIATETELQTCKELSEKRLKEIEELQKDLEESRCINGMIHSSGVGTKFTFGKQNIYMPQLLF